MKSLSLFALALLASSPVLAANSDWQPTVLCSAELKRIDLKDILKTEKTEFTNFELKPMDGNDPTKRLRAEGTLKFSEGYEVAVSVVLAPGASLLVRGGDSLLGTARLQQRSDDGKVHVLSLGDNVSDFISDTREIPRLKDMMSVSETLPNPAVTEAIVNSGERMSVYTALQKGLIANGTVTEARFFCAIHKKKN